MGSFHDVVSGVDESLLLKYGDRAERMNLCREKESLIPATVISAVFGWSLVSNVVRWAAKGCNGSADFE